MRTPKNYTQSVNDKKITNEMIAECIYSVNKRAKNHRDRIRKYKEDRYNPYAARIIENAEDEMEKYYTMKEEMLTVFEPSLIHEQYVGEEKKRVFSTEEDYDKLLQEKSNDIIWKSGYLSTLIRYEELHAINPNQARATPKEHHDFIVKHLVDNTRQLEELTIFERIQIYQRDRSCVYDSEQDKTSAAEVLQECLFGKWSKVEEEMLKVGEERLREMSKSNGNDV